jgi:hypothetical protein
MCQVFCAVSLLSSRQGFADLFNRIRQQPLDGFPIPPIIERNLQPMNTLFSLSLIVVLIVVLIIKDLFVVGMATVRVK